jgi:hypothetical protein
MRGLRLHVHCRAALAFDPTGALMTQLVQRRGFDQPATVAEAEARVVDLTRSVENYEQALMRSDVDSVRRRAIANLIYRHKDEIRFLNTWLERNRLEHVQLFAGCAACSAPHPGPGAPQLGWVYVKAGHRIHGPFHIWLCPLCGGQAHDAVARYLEARDG